MSEEVKVLIAKARTHAACECHFEGVQMRGCGEHGDDESKLIAELADALEAAQQAPAVDREALELVCVAEVERLAPNNQHAGDIGSSVASALIAFGVLQDAAAVRKDGDRDGVRRMADQIDRDLFRFAQQEIGQAELLDRLADLVALARAQHVREGNA